MTWSVRRYLTVLKSQRAKPFNTASEAERKREKERERGRERERGETERERVY